MSTIAPRSHVLGWAVLMVVLTGGFALYVKGAGMGAAVQVAAEDDARAVMLQVAEAQKSLLAQSGRYGWISALEAAGLLGDLEIETIDGIPSVVTAAYRVDVLLPVARTPENHVRVGAEGGEPPDRPLLTRHFAVLARPRAPRQSGFRLYYVDESGDIWLSDAVSDERAFVGVALPEIHFTAGAPELDALGPGVWVKESEMVPR